MTNPARQCKGKQKLDEQGAVYVASIMKVKKKDPRYHEYLCPLCGAFHVGRNLSVSKKGKQLKKMKRTKACTCCGREVLSSPVSDDWLCSQCFTYLGYMIWNADKRQNLYAK